MLWSITSYFNPRRYSTKRANYHLFRQHLATPLLTVELSFESEFELRSDDADHLVQLRGGDVLWQKERLLNVALDLLPMDCEAVAWLDADIIFADPDWATAALGALEHRTLVQPFSDMLNLPRGVSLASAARFTPQRLAVARWLKDSGMPADAIVEPGSAKRFAIVPGRAWVARRELLVRHGWYDTFVIGGGDKLLVLAALGQAQRATAAYLMNPRQEAHYLAWAMPFHADVRGHIDCVPGRLVHLWHGDFDNRLYSARYRGFSEFDFDPTTDIRLGENGCWCWNSDKPAMHEYVAEYFGRRDEDGTSPSP
jgi:hypothetical protein